ncbi:MAG: hypothetical protein LBT30_04965 [Clostridiales bacterium]|jgi:hypothetical protein|nr:hypothetical protein [Clostridiales bacterium]
MNALRKEINDYINLIPDKKLSAILPLVEILAEDSFIVETNLTKNEKEIIKKGRIEFDKGNYVTIDQIK